MRVVESDEMNQHWGFARVSLWAALPRLESPPLPVLGAPAAPPPVSAPAGCKVRVGPLLGKGGPCGFCRKRGRSEGKGRGCVPLEPRPGLTLLTGGLPGRGDLRCLPALMPGVTW